jgi:hypothetical protein
MFETTTIKSNLSVFKNQMKDDREIKLKTFSKNFPKFL